MPSAPIMRTQLQAKTPRTCLPRRRSYRVKKCRLVEIDEWRVISGVELRDIVDNLTKRGAELDRDKAGKADVSREALHWMTSTECGIVHASSLGRSE